MNTRQLFLNHLAQMSEGPLGIEIVRAQGHYLYDQEGNKYLDLISGIAVSSIGHCHPKVVAAIQRQAETYMHTMVYGEFVLHPQVACAQNLISTLPESLNCVYFSNSGTEAVEGALKLAKKYTKRYQIIAASKAYHGSSSGATVLNSETSYVQSFRPLMPGVRHIAFNDMDDLAQITDETAAVILEVIQAERGIYPADKPYLQALRKKCTETGTLLIFDEIQSGMGRTGKMYAFEHYDVVPDVLLLAKALGGGMPIGAFISSSEIMATFSKEPALNHITTFGGHPVICAAANATLNVLKEENWIDNVPAKAQLFKELLHHDEILELRSFGLWFAIELGSSDKRYRAMTQLMDRGIFLDWFLFNDNALRICPPLSITKQEITWVCAEIRSVLSDL